MKNLPLLFLMWCLVRCACAQQTPASNLPPLPPGPLLNPVADNARWTITFKSVEVAKSAKVTGSVRSAKSGKKPQARAIIGEKMGNVVHVVDLMPDGTKEEKWSNGSLTATLSPGAPEPTFATGVVEELPMPTWISPKNYVDVTSEGKKSGLVFRDRIIPTGTEVVQDDENLDKNDPEKLKVEAKAIIDAESRLPIEVTEGGVTITYKFEPLAPGTQIIPAAIQTALVERGKQMQDTVRQTVRP